VYPHASCRFLAVTKRILALLLRISHPETFRRQEDLASLDAVMRRVAESPGAVVFLDEIHDLSGPHTRKLYLVLEEGRYLFHGERTPTQLPPVTLLGATTDYGALHPALKRRWIRHMFRPATEDQLLNYVLHRPFPIPEPVAQRIVARTKFSGAPWEALEIYRMAVTAAKGRGAPAVDHADVDRVFALQEMDELGLRWIDRQVIAALLTQPKYRRAKGQDVFVCFSASEQNVCTLANVDKGEFRESIRPRLMSRGLLQVKQGQALTDKAVELYGPVHV
jgi:Holliday junction resolvasome RuvABC ATP-dependent DNA helicase subunit